MNGICCPACGHEDNHVIGTARVEDGIRRRRVCEHCGKRWNTFEFAEESERQLNVQRAKLVRAQVDAQLSIRDAIQALQRIKI